MSTAWVVHVSEGLFHSLINSVWTRERMWWGAELRVAAGFWVMGGSRGARRGFDDGGIAAEMTPIVKGEVRIWVKLQIFREREMSLPEENLPNWPWWPLCGTTCAPLHKHCRHSGPPPPNPSPPPKLFKQVEAAPTANEKLTNGV